MLAAHEQSLLAFFRLVLPLLVEVHVYFTINECLMGCWGGGGVLNLSCSVSLDLTICILLGSLDTYMCISCVISIFSTHQNEIL